MPNRKLALLLTLLVGLMSACTLSKGAGGDTETVNNYIEGKGSTGIRGQITAKATGQPIEGAYVNIYPDAISNLLGPSQYISTPTDANGNYKIDVPPGSYYVVSRKRMSGQPSGPLAPGDLFSEHQRVKTTVVAGKLSIIDLPLAPMKAPMFFKKSTVETQTDTGIRGRLIDSEGKPVPGSFAVAYDNTDIKRLPDYASTLSDSNGNFVIFLPQGGTYYLSARIHAWDMPRPGELYGTYGEPDPAPITVSKGAFVKEIEIVLTPFTGTYKEGKSRRPY
ncbi:MAG: hypothetical protein C0623_05265 [Desulfuromonas sp.]|nr:MAG: hypothetical protein C0623_05265 [Desulfuromonas sp.]